MSELLHRETTDAIVGVYYTVLNERGTGYLEKVAQRAMAIALTDAGLRVRSDVSLPVWFRGLLIGDFVAGQ